MNPFRKARSSILSALAFTGLVTMAQGQSFDAAPIAIDVIAGQADTPVLVAAYTPPANSTPLLGSSETRRDAVIIPAGFPAPSIILGHVQPGQESAFGITSLLPETVRQAAFSHDDLEARIQLRTSNPDLLRLLIEQGHIDPPNDLLNAALQTELQRMNCYRSGIDGAWGPGSRRSVGAYFEERDDGTAWPEQGPSVELYRTIILYDDVQCPTPKPAARAEPSRPVAKAKPAPAPAPARAPKPAAKAPSNKPKISSGAGIGVFR